MKSIFVLLFSFMTFLALGQESDLDIDTAVNFQNNQLDISEIEEEIDSYDDQLRVDKESKQAMKTKESFINQSQNKAFDQNEWNKITSDPKYQYKKPEEKKEKNKNDRKRLKMPKISRNTWTLIAYSIIAVALSLLLYAIFGTDTFARSDPKIDTEVEMDVEDIAHFTEWDTALLLAEKQGDYRKAIQVLYNETLQKFIQAELIHYKREFTNNMYVNKLRNTVHHKDFARHTRIFDYVWYGMATITDEEYNSIKASMKQAQSRIIG